MATRKNANLAWLVQPSERFGTRFLKATVVIPQPNGELHSPLWTWSGEASEFADFEVSAYIGHDSSTFGTADSNPGEIWGLSHGFTPHNVGRIEHAKSMVSVFGKVTRGLAKAEAESGYVRDGDFHAYLLRIGASLGITTYYVRNLPRQRDMSGELFRKVTPGTLQWYVGDVSDTAVNRPQELIGR